jgi:FkbM family methyltransferase
MNYDMATNGELHLLDSLVGHDIKTVFDVGANKGEYTKHCLQRFPNAEVHAFEIVPATFQKLKSELAGNNRAMIQPFGLSNRSGVTEINFNPRDDGISSLVAGEGIHKGSWQTLAVEVKTGDEYVSSHDIKNIDLLKIDVEGGESYVLEGLNQALSDQKIGVVQFEFGMANIYSKFLLNDYWQLFGKHDFAIGPLMPKGVRFRQYNPRDEDFQGPPNFVAVHRSRPNIINALELK